MVTVEHRELPADSLLVRHRDDGAYTDCYAVEIDRSISLSQYIEAFYTTPLFKLERSALKWLVAKPSSDEEARALALGKTNAFAA